MQWQCRSLATLSVRPFFTHDDELTMQEGGGRRGGRNIYNYHGGVETRCVDVGVGARGKVRNFWSAALLLGASCWSRGSSRS